MSEEERKARIEEKNKISAVYGMFELQKAKNNIAFLQAGGEVAFNDELSLKWNDFVEHYTNNGTRGEFLNETLQIAMMIKAGVSPETIGKVMSTMPSYGTVVTYLGVFIPADLLFEIKTNINSDGFHPISSTGTVEDIDHLDSSLDENLRINAACRMLRKEDAMLSVPFWEACGSVIFGEDFSNKWSKYVRESAQSDYDCRHGLSASLQVATMLKAGVSVDTVRDVLSSYDDQNFVVNSLGMFVHPDVVSKITPRQNKY